MNFTISQKYNNDNNVAYVGGGAMSQNFYFDRFLKIFLSQKQISYIIHSCKFRRGKV